MYQTKYLEMAKKVQELEKKYNGAYFTDMCIDSENCNHMNDNSEEFWKEMCEAFQASTGMRMAEFGISNEEMAEVGVYY